MISVWKITCLLLLCLAIIEGKENHQKSIKKTNKKHQTKHSKHTSRSSDQCKWICPESGNYTEEIFRIGNILVFESVKAAIALDLDNYYLVAVNSESQVIIIFNLHAKVYYRVQDSQVAWNSSDSFSTYLKSINNFDTIIKLAKQNGQNGQSADDITDSVLQEYTRVVYDVGFSTTFTRDTLLYYVNTLPSLIDLLNGPLQGYLQDTSRARSIYGVDFQANLVAALGSLFSYASGTLQALQKDGVKLDYNLIMNVNSGFEILLIVLENVGEHEDLAKVFGRVVNHPELIFTFIAQFNSTGGVDPIINVIYNLIQVSQGHNGSISNIYRMIIWIAENFNPNSFGSELRSLVIELGRILQTQSQRFNNSQQLQGLNNFIQGLQNNNLNIGGINISELIQTIIRNVPNVLRTIIQVFSQISNGSGSGLNISQIIQQITQYLSQNLDSISELFPGLHISGRDFGSILEEIIENFNIGDIFGGSGENIISILSRIPVIGDIIREIQRVIPSANIEDLQKIFNPQNILRIARRIFTEIQGNTNFQDIIKIIIKEIGTIVQSNGSGGSGSDSSSSSSSSSDEDSGSGSSERRHHRNNNGNGHSNSGRGRGRNNGNGNGNDNGNGNGNGRGRGP